MAALQPALEVRLTFKLGAACLVCERNAISAV
jgi:hypothetical protein